LIERSYQCNSCQFSFNTEQSITEPYFTTCPHCKQETLEKLFTPCVPFVIIKGEPTTLGQLAEANNKKFGKEQVSLKQEEDRRKRTRKSNIPLTYGAKPLDRSKPERPWYRPDSDTVLNLKKIKNVERYIETGVES
jgi:putative FmdB family regulatory protein